MELVLDYLKRDLVSINDNGWQDIDGIVCNLLSYINYHIDNKIAIRDLYKINSNDKLLELLVNNNRYKDIVIEDITKIKDEEVQFGAIKIDILGNKCIAFQGTDGSIVGWRENFNICFYSPTKTQEVAIKYLKDNIEDNMVIVGHSKGGNLAVVSSINLSSKDKKRIVKIYNFDGPGLTTKEFKSRKSLLVKDKITTYLPETSIVGIFMNNYNIKCIQARGHGFYEHMLNNWYIEDYNLVEGILSDSSKKANKDSIKAIDNYNIEECKMIVEEFFRMLKKYKVVYWKDLNNIDIDKLFTEMRKVKISEEIRDYYVEIFKSMIH